MEVCLVSQDPGSLQGVILVFLREFLNCVEGFLVDKKSLLDPALDAAGRTDASKSLFAVEHSRRAPRS